MLEVIILAAGKGNRMQSDLPKVLHTLAGQPLIQHVLGTASALAADRVHVVVGHGAEQVQAAIADPNVSCHLQVEQLGTGHAVQQAIGHCDPASTVLVLYGDVPLIGVDALTSVVTAAQDGAAVLSADLAQPQGYGRILRDAAGEFAGVVEQRDASPEQLALSEVNTGVLAAPAAQLAQWLQRVENHNAQSEYYLPDVLSLALTDGVPVRVIQSQSLTDALGVNDPLQLEQLERLHQRSLAEKLMAAGVKVADRNRIDIRGTLQCGRGVSIDPNVLFEGDVVLGDDVHIGAQCVIRNARLASGTNIQPFSHLDGVTVGEEAQIGPFARLRPGTTLHKGTKVGNFVEIKNTELGEGAKANHLAYLGDADIGAHSNVGAGTIICNYDGAEKHRTELGEGVFIGSNSTLVAPLTIASGGFIAAGSTITDDVKADQLAVARGRQRNVDGWQRPTKPGKDA